MFAASAVKSIAVTRLFSTVEFNRLNVTSGQIAGAWAP
jgi:hypothetical protein